jgi:hypothetical protein
MKPFGHRRFRIGGDLPVGDVNKARALGAHDPPAGAAERGIETEDDARAWQRNAEHAAVQGKGRAEYYESYTVYSCNEPQVRTFDRKGL